MAARQNRPDDAGCIVLVVPVGAAKSKRLVIPHEIALWLRDELCQAIGGPSVTLRDLIVDGQRADAQTPPTYGGEHRHAKARRKVRIHRGQWRA